MSPIPRLTSEQRNDLVAYLDGELDDDNAREIENVLASSDVARHEIEMLGRTWDLLESLPRETASAEFTARTLATVKLDETPQTRAWQPWLRRGLLLSGWTTTLAAAVIFGVTLGYRWTPRSNDEVVRDLPLARNIDAYRDAGSIEFLRELDESRLPTNDRENAR